MGLGSSLMTTSSNAVKILDDHKDVILLGAGLVTGLGTVIFASRATLKADKKLKEVKKSREYIAKACEEVPGYSGSDDHRTDVAGVYIDAGISLAKMYAPAVVLGATSAACLIGEHCVMQKRVNNLEKAVASLSAAYIAVDTAFKKYRKRVVAKYGEEEDKNLRYGVEEETVETMDENGKKKKETKKILTGDFDKNDFVKIIDGTPGKGKGLVVWKDIDHNKIDTDLTTRQIWMMESWLNDRLGHQKYVTFNEMQDAIDFTLTTTGWDFGWVVDPDDPDNIRCKISLNPYNIVRRKSDGTLEEVIVIEPNIDGYIRDKINLPVK